MVCRDSRAGLVGQALALAHPRVRLNAAQVDNASDGIAAALEDRAAARGLARVPVADGRHVSPRCG